MYTSESTIPNGGMDEPRSRIATEVFRRLEYRRPSRTLHGICSSTLSHTQSKSPCTRSIGQQPWFQYLGGISKHDTITLRVPAFSEGASGWEPLKVGRAQRTEPPEVPENLVVWLDAEWRTEPDPRPIPERESDHNGKLRLKEFTASAERVRAIHLWSVGHKAWAVADQSSKSALKLFEKLYEV